jgi:hypothetical protein
MLRIEGQEPRGDFTIINTVAKNRRPNGSVIGDLHGCCSNHLGPIVLIRLGTGYCLTAARKDIKPHETGWTALAYDMDGRELLIELEGEE